MSVCNSAIPGCRDAWTTLMMGVEVLNGGKIQYQKSPSCTAHIVY